MLFEWKKGTPVLWEEFTWEEVEEYVDHCNMVVIPVGATEPHGPHLPLMTDTAQSYEICKRVSANTGVPVIPPVAIGISQSHGNFPGTLWVRVDTMISLLYDLCTSLYQSGVRKYFFINGHMYNDWGIKGVRDHFRCDYDDVQITTLNYWQAAKTRFAEDCPQKKHIHGNFGETSQLLALRPDLVKMERAENTADFFTLFDYRFDQVSKNGVIGENATGGTAEAGEIMLGQFEEKITELVKLGLEEKIPIPGGYQRKNKSIVEKRRSWSR